MISNGYIVWRHALGGRAALAACIKQFDAVYFLYAETTVYSYPKASSPKVSAAVFG